MEANLAEKETGLFVDEEADEERLSIELRTLEELLEEIIEPEAQTESEEDYGEIKDRPRNNSRNSFAMYLSEIANYKLLKHSQIKLLARKAQQGDKEALKQIVEANLRLVVYFAKRYIAYIKDDASLYDIVQEGNLGLTRAIEKYDTERDIRFSTYAGPWIRVCVLRAIGEENSLIHIPVYLQDEKKKYYRIVRELSRLLKQKAAPQDAAKKMGIKEKRLRRILEIPKVISLDMPLRPEEPDEITLKSNIPDKRILDPEKITCEKDRRKELEKLLGTLSPREEKILRLRFGLDGPEKTLKEAGEEFHLTRERIRQIEVKALRKLKRRAKKLKIFLE